VYVLGYDRHICAIVNSYAFSIAMVCLYLHPFLSLSSSSWVDRIQEATTNWIVWLSVFTEIVFQIPHNLFVAKLHAVKGSPFEWPFFTYGLSDSRWNNYHDGTGLAPEVWLINVNDAAMALLIVAFYIYYVHMRKKSARDGHRAKIMFALVVMFRDATLFRETIEYFWDHHRKGYPYTTTNLDYRRHGIICLWLVNIIWVVAPCVTVFWVYNIIFEAEISEKKKIA
jgi:hypothetical protein